jgi:hypothetical protein
VFFYAFRCLCQELQWYFLFTSAPTAPSTPRLSCVEERAFPSLVPTLLATVISTVPLSCQCFASNRIVTFFLVHSRRSTFAIPSVPSSEGQSTSDRFQLRWQSTLLFHCLSSSDSLQELILFFSFMFDTPSPFMTRQAILRICQSYLLCFLLLRSITLKRRFQLRWLLLPTLLRSHCHFRGLLPEVVLMYFWFMSHTPLPVTSSGQRLGGEHQHPQSLVPISLATTNNTSVPLFRRYFLIMGDNFAHLSCSSVSGFRGASTSKSPFQLRWLLSRTLHLVYCPFIALLPALSRFFSFMGDTFCHYFLLCFLLRIINRRFQEFLWLLPALRLLHCHLQCWLVSDYAFLHLFSVPTQFARPKGPAT